MCKNVGVINNAVGKKQAYSTGPYLGREQKTTALNSQNIVYCIESYILCMLGNAYLGLLRWNGVAWRSVT